MGNVITHLHALCLCSCSRRHSPLCFISQILPFFLFPTMNMSFMTRVMQIGIECDHPLPIIYLVKYIVFILYLYSTSHSWESKLLWMSNQALIFIHSYFIYEQLIFLFDNFINKTTGRLSTTS